MARLETAILLAGALPPRRRAGDGRRRPRWWRGRWRPAAAPWPIAGWCRRCCCGSRTSIARKAALASALAALVEARHFESRDTATLLARLGLVSREAGDLEAARGYFEEALALVRRGRGGPAPDDRLLPRRRPGAHPLRGRLAEPRAGRRRRRPAPCAAVDCGAALVAEDGRDVSKRYALLEGLKVAGGILAATDPAARACRC